MNNSKEIESFQYNDVEMRKPLNFLQAATLLFVGLQLTGYIDWPWWRLVLPVIIESSFRLIHLGSQYAAYRLEKRLLTKEVYRSDVEFKGL